MLKTRMVFAVLALTTLVSSVASAQTWKKFKSATGGFSIKSPGKLVESTRNVPSGKNQAMTMYSCEYKSDTFMVSHTDFPPETFKKATIARLLEGGRDGAIRSLGGKLVSEKNITLAGSPGLDIVIKTEMAPTSTVKVRFVFVKRRLYQALVIAQNDRPLPPDTDRFIRSLVIERK